MSVHTALVASIAQFEPLDMALRQLDHLADYGRKYRGPDFVDGIETAMRTLTDLGARRHETPPEPINWHSPIGEEAVRLGALSIRSRLALQLTEA